MAIRHERTKSASERVLSSRGKLQGSLDLVIQTWNNSSHALEALESIKVLTGLPEESIRSTIRTLQKSGIVRSLPVRQGADDLTLEEVYMFCLTWNRAALASDAIKQLSLSPPVAYERANLLRRLGVSLDNKPDFAFDTLKVTRTNVWDGDVDKINEALNEELLVRNGLLRRKEVLKKVGVLVRTLIKLRNDKTPSLDDHESFVAVAESVLRDLGVVA